MSEYKIQHLVSLRIVAIADYRQAINDGVDATEYMENVNYYTEELKKLGINQFENRV